MKEWIKDHDKLLIVCSILEITALAALSFYIGKKHGTNGLIESLIHQYENGNIDWPVYTSSDKRLGNLMYEISAECIGD